MARNRPVEASDLAYAQLVALALFWTSLGAAQIHTVAPPGAGAADFNDIQEALDAAADGDTVLVAPGTYELQRPLDPNRLHEPGDSGTPPVKDVLIRSERGPEETILRLTAREPSSVEIPIPGATPVTGTGGSVVMFVRGESRRTRLEGFTLTGGFGTRWTHDVCDELGRCHEYQESGGGGLLITNGAAPVIANCSISGNWAGGTGGGVHCGSQASPLFLDCVIERNRADAGGGVYSFEASPAFASCRIESNHGREQGGGVYLREQAGEKATFSACRIIGNRSARGGGIYCLEASPEVTNSILAGNAALHSGIGDEGPGYGGALLAIGNSRPTIVHSTITHNRATVGGAMIASAVVLRSSIVYASSNPTSMVDAGDEVTGEVDIETSLVGVDPRFVRSPELDFDRSSPIEGSSDPYVFPDFFVVEGDYRLTADSPAIDAADPSEAPESDIDGNTRPCGDGVDIGAHEFGACGPARRFLRGDCNMDGPVDISDSIAHLDALFLGSGAVPCEDACDSNDDGKGDISDAITTLGFLFLGNGSLPPPGAMACGLDPSADDLGCESPSLCP